MGAVSQIGGKKEARLAALAEQKQLASLLAGGVAGSLSSTVTCPIEVVKTKLQGSSLSSPGTIVGQILQREGVRGFFRGLPPTLLGILPARSTYFWAYSTTKSWLVKRWEENPVVHIASAVVAGVVSNTVTNPIWMVKTRLQLFAGEANAYEGFRNSVSRIFQEEGVSGFFRGLSASYWGVAEGAIHFVIYEGLKQRLVASKPGTATGEKVEASKLELFGAAAVAKLFASALTYPHEVVRTRMRIPPAPGQLPKYRTMIQSLSTIGREEGMKGLYGGMGAHLLRVVPNAALMFLTYESVMRWFDRIEKENSQSQKTELALRRQ
ncbi:hypothetical protein NDN08_000341 [Rhodosorus marinus]|uniref:Mitochondrial carrier protein n=1 Tax=Rhodosorus marinus TaxID=101924 RepID=A0AAV8UQE6_9RHOD|nr:hypothetical protein NDN08_000341 [Rhodosorus marinus]